LLGQVSLAVVAVMKLLVLVVVLSIKIGRTTTILMMCITGYLLIAGNYKGYFHEDISISVTFF
jgi:hypothetical protein